ncbi:E3 ubiquitin-protein ligase TRIM23 isoform X3 [Rhinoderma darwinii]|uniref:E3 ubiquitin-protein ligase TRIM23 isoform X3 n=1 Tax=Rhinoderma darwinii TaxID=43563 RepID=UPI003F6817AB
MAVAASAAVNRHSSAGRMEGISRQSRTGPGGTVKVLECGVCEDVFTLQGDKVPRLLLCGHTVCHDCLTRLPLHGRAIRCPFDRQVTELGDSGVWGLKKNFALLELLERLQNGASGQSGSSEETVGGYGELGQTSTNQEVLEFPLRVGQTENYTRRTAGMRRGMDVERLISLVREKGEIWDTHAESYHNRTAKEDAWEEIAQALFGSEWESSRTRGRTRMVQDVKTCWRSCRDQFRREMGDRGRSGYGASQKRPYKYTKHLMFLKDIMVMRSTTDNLNDTEEESDMPESVPQPPSSRVVSLTPEPTPQDPAPVESAPAVLSPPENSPRGQPPRRRRSQQPDAGATVDTLVLDYLRRAADQDGQDFFARAIVPLLRRVPEDRMARLYSAIITLIDCATPPHNPNHCFTAIEQWRGFAVANTTSNLPAPYHPPTPSARPHPYYRPMAPPFPGPSYQGHHPHHYAGEEHPPQLHGQHSGAEMPAYFSPGHHYQHL